MDWTKLLSSERIRRSTPTDRRNAFESDYGRIIYSPALRRMHDKTQVFPLTTDDNIHSRLTHSNEVMSLGYTFGIKLSESEKFQRITGKTESELFRIIPILLQNICLVHDIGNSPFGHFGETIICNYFKELFEKEKEYFSALTPHQKSDFVHYDGNAQGLRVLTKLQILNDPFGLNLTYATLASSIKYPNFKKINKLKKKEKETIGEIFNDNFIENNKHGIFYSELEYFDLIVNETGLKLGDRELRHPLCYLMEAADTIAYLCMDMEDGFNKGIYSLDHIAKKFRQHKEIEVCKEVYDILTDKFQDETYKIVSARIKLIAYFVKISFDNFINNLDRIENGTYNEELIEDDNNNVYEIVKSFSTEIFKSREINNLESTGYSVIVGLLEFYTDFIFLKKDDSFANRTTALISKSIIDAAIEENLIKTCERKIENIITDLQSRQKIFQEKDNIDNKLNKNINKALAIQNYFSKLSPIYLELFEKQKKQKLTAEEYKRLSKVRFKIIKNINPCFNDLDLYYKLRVVVDFISGMTDQYALKHYQKISGQRIN